jgi:hypothetical protein
VVVPKVTWAAAGSSLFFDFKDGKGKVQWIYKIDALKDQPTTDDGEITQTEVDGVKVDNSKFCYYGHVVARPCYPCYAYSTCSVTDDRGF